MYVTLWTKKKKLLEIKTVFMENIYPPPPKIKITKTKTKTKNPKNKECKRHARLKKKICTNFV